MRNRVLTVTMLAALVVSPLLAQGQTAPPAGTAGKVGIINIQQAILISAEGKKAFTDLQDKYKPRQDEITRRQQEVSALQDQIQRQISTLSDEEERRLTRDLAEKQKMLKRLTEDAQSEFQDDRQDVMRRIGQKMVQVIDQYAQQHGFELVIDSSQIPIYYAAKGIDITEDIVKQYDAQYPVQASGTSGTASPAAPAKQAAPKANSKPNP